MIRSWNFNKKVLLITGMTFCLSLISDHHAKAGAEEDLLMAIKSGSPTLELRLGFEYSSVDNNTSPAKGLNLRTRVGYRTGEFKDASCYIQLHNVSNLVEEFRFKHDGEIHGSKSRDVIGDPDGSRVHQAYLDFTGISDTTLRLGRQEIILDDARLIGNIDWRQNGQSFDAISITNKSVPDLSLFASYINNVNTIFLDDQVDGGKGLDSLILINGKYTGIEDHTIATFCYLLDTDVTSDGARDSVTFGLRITGKCPKIKYAFDFSKQADYQDGEDHDGEMANAFLGTKIKALNIGAGYSYISGQDGDDRPFDTLFSTTHKFNGWADQFLGTNGGKLINGLEDVYFQVDTQYKGIKLMAVYHYFDTTEDETFDGKYGDEVGLLIAKKIDKNLSLLFKSSFYNADSKGANPTQDEDIYWARIQYKF